MRYAAIVGLTFVAFILGGCGVTPYSASNTFAKSIKEDKKMTATLVVPDTHVVEMSFSGKALEKYAESQKASNIFSRQARVSLASYFQIKSIKGSLCPMIKTDTNSSAKVCSSNMRNLRQIFEKSLRLDRKNKVYARNITLNRKTDVTIYLYAVEPTRTTEAKVASGLLTVALAVATGGAATVVHMGYHDTLRMVVINNRTKEVIWQDTIITQVDIDEPHKVAKNFKTFTDNLKKFKASQK